MMLWKSTCSERTRKQTALIRPSVLTVQKVWQLQRPPAKTKSMGLVWVGGRARLASARRRGKDSASAASRGQGHTQGISPERFALFVRRHPSLLQPAHIVRLQLQRRILGKQFWEKTFSTAPGETWEDKDPVLIATAFFSSQQPKHQVSSSSPSSRTDGGGPSSSVAVAPTPTTKKAIKQPPRKKTESKGKGRQGQGR